MRDSMRAKKCERLNPVTLADGTIEMRRCGHLVGEGNMHAVGHCPAPAKPGANRSARYHARNAARRRAEAEAAKAAAIAAERAAGREAAKEAEAKKAGYLRAA